jgi:hypothetical protein
MILDVGDKVQTIKKVTQKDYDILKHNNIKPGTVGEIVGITILVNFNGVIVELDESAIRFYVHQNTTPDKQEDSIIDNLRNIFGMK